MGKNRYFVIPLVMVFLMACGLSNGIQQIQQAATQLPGILTSAPTALGAIETSVAQSSSACGTSTSGGLGIGLANAKTVLELTQQVTFTEGIVEGQPVSTATLTSTAASAFPAIATGFSAQFIGDPCNLTRILVTAPRTDQQDTADQGMGIINVLISGFMPLDVQLPLLTWLTQNYADVPVGGQQQTTIGTMQFTLQRTQTEMTLEVVPAK
jgi:hypothetical protein